MSFGTIHLKIPRMLKINRSNILLLTVFTLIFVSNDTFMFGTNRNSLMLEIPRVLMGIYIVYELMRLLINRVKINQTIIVGLIMMAMMIFISVYHRDPVKLIIIKSLCIFSSALLTIHYDFDEYAEAFSKVMVFFGVMALVLEVIGYTLPSVAYGLPRIVNTANNEITTIGFAGFLTAYLSTKIIRTFGIFWEPGVFHMYLNLALMFELFYKKRISWRNVIILLVSVLITLSTTGYIVSAWILVVYFCLERKKSLTRKNMIIISVIFVGLMVAFFAMDFTFVGESVFGKLSNQEDGSWIARAASVFVNLDIFFDHPVFGVGMNQINTEMMWRSTLMFARMTRHNTNTLLYQFAAHGGLYGGIFAAGTFMFPKCLSSKKAVIIALAIALVLMYVGENLRYSMFPFILIFYGFSKKNHVENRIS